MHRRYRNPRAAAPKGCPRPIARPPVPPLPILSRDALQALVAQMID
jgi:hypothetical protein